MSDLELIQPNPGPQTEFCKSRLYDVGYGGAKKGGKALTPDHDVLTDKGWVPIGDIKVGDRVASLEQSNHNDDGRLVYASVWGVHYQNHDGPLLRSRYRPYFAASPEHRWLVSTVPKGNKPNRWRYVDSTGLKNVHRIPATGGPMRLLGTQLSDADMELMGWYISEGCRCERGRMTLFAQTKPEGRERIAELLNRVGAHYTLNKQGVRAKWDPPFDCGSDCYNKFIPRILLRQNNLWCLINGLVDGDGYRKRKGFELYTASKQLCDDIQEAITVLGWRAVASEKKTKYTNSERPIANGKGRIKNAQNWRISCYPRRFWHLSKSGFKWEEYKGRTYCLSVPRTGNFIARHKGSVFVTGNSWALILMVLYFIMDPRFRGLIVRRESTDLTNLWDEAKILYRKACPEVKLHETLKRAYFPSGAWVWFAACKTLKDTMDYQGHKYQFLGIDEATQWANPDVLLTLSRELLAQLDPETGRPWMQPLLRTTANPIGPGVPWYKKRYQLSKYPKGGIYYDEATESYRQFIHSVAADNPKIDAVEYVKSLRGNSKSMQKALIDGDFNSPEGAAFEEFDYERHVIKPWKRIPAHYDIYRSGDYGFATWTAVHWWAYNPENKALICIGELSLTRTKPAQIAKLVLDYEERQGWKVEDAVMDPAAWSKEGTSAMSPAFQMMEHGLDWRQAHNDRVLGYQAMMTRLVTDVPLNDGTLVPAIRFMDSRCPRLIETLPALPQQQGEDDVDKKECKQGEGIDHWYDSCFVSTTCVDTAMGGCPIGRLAEDDGAVVFDLMGNGTPGIHPRLTRRNAPTVVVEFDDGRSVRCTPDHLFCTEDGWVEAMDLKRKWVLDTSDTLGYFGSYGPNRNLRDDPGIQQREVLPLRALLQKATEEDGAPAAQGRMGVRPWKGPKRICRPPQKRGQKQQFNLESGVDEQGGAQPPSRHGRHRSQAGTLYSHGDTCRKSLAPEPRRESLALTERQNRFRKAFLHGARMYRMQTAVQNQVAGQFEVLPPDVQGPGTKGATGVSEEGLDIAPTALAARVSSVTPAPPADVYCLTVPDTGTFTVEGGLVVSNCRYMCAALELPDTPEEDEGRHIRWANESDETEYQPYDHTHQRGY